MASNLAHSLPPFAQAFSTHSLSSISTQNNALPPIHPRISPDAHRLDDSAPRSDDDPPPPPRKRPHQDISHSPPTSQRASPRLPHIKQEQDQDRSPSPPDPLDGPPPSPGSSSSPLKRRRVTISGGPHPLNTDLRPVADQTNSTPISPVVMGVTINRDNPAAMEQVRSMLSVKQKQKALIEQRRGTSGPNTTNSEERLTAPKSAVPPRSARHSPSMRRGVPPAGNTRPTSPNPMLAPSHHPNPPAPAPSQTLPFPPISFARRRADVFGGKKKPADILISPRETQSSDSLQPAIQSAPPIPHAGQGNFQASRLGMALPRLPPAMSATDNVRKVASNVPPTPTRLARFRPAAPAAPMITRRSPPAPSVPIAATLVPPTPASLQHPGYSGDKNAFLAPFEIFYDALNDSRQLKTWLSEQLQRSNALVQSLTLQQEKLNETIEAAVEQRVNSMRAEMTVLRRRVEDLEDALRNASPDRRPSIDKTGGAVPVKGKQPIRNGANFGPPESSTFQPSHEPPRHRSDAGRRPSPSWSQEWDVRGHVPPPPPHSGDGDRQISPPYDSRRLATVSASRLDPPRTRDLESSSHHPRANVPSPPQAYRENSSSQNYAPVRDSHPRARERPGLTRQHSHSEGNSSPIPVPSSNSPHSNNQQPPRRVSSPRVPSIMSPPEVHGNENS